MERRSALGWLSLPAGLLIWAGTRQSNPPAAEEGGKGRAPGAWRRRRGGGGSRICAASGGGSISASCRRRPGPPLTSSAAPPRIRGGGETDWFLFLDHVLFGAFLSAGISCLVLSRAELLLIFSRWFSYGRVLFSSSDDYDEREKNLSFANETMQ